MYPKSLPLFTLLLNVIDDAPPGFSWSIIIEPLFAPATVPVCSIKFNDPFNKVFP